MSLPSECRLSHAGWELMGVRFAIKHLPGVLALEQVCFPSPWSEELLRQEALNQEHSWNMVVLIQEQLDAFFFNWTILDEMHLLNFAVHPERRQRGLGAFLLDWMLAQAKANGYHNVNLEVRESNRPAIRLYESRGFATLFRRRGYYTDNGEDALVMLRALNPEESRDAGKGSETRS